jgi:GNAT superfamily N-acetyltransferase
MSAIQVLPLCSPKERELFLTFPWRIYRHDPLWVPPLLPERRKFIDPAHGPFYKHGEAEFFLAWRDGRPVGTLCVAEDRQMNQLRGKKDCIFGFLDYLEDYEVFCALMAHTESAAGRRGLDTLYGPWNLDYEDGYGVLLEGRDRPPVILCGHTPPYYLDYMQRYGFEPARPNNLAFAVDISQETDAFRDLARMAQRVSERTPVTIRTADLAHWDREIDAVHKLLNAALAHLDDFLPWSREQVEALFSPFRTLADLELILFAEVDGETIGFFPGLPNFNEWTIHANGLRYPWDYLRAWLASRRQPACLAVKSVLVLPEYWGNGTAILLFHEMLSRAIAKGYKWIDLSLTSDDNPKTPMLAERMGGKVYKRYRVFLKKSGKS